MLQMWTLVNVIIPRTVDSRNSCQTPSKNMSLFRTVHKLPPGSPWVMFWTYLKPGHDRVHLHRRCRSLPSRQKASPSKIRHRKEDGNAEQIWHCGCIGWVTLSLNITFP
jgi:hypothetical protein